MPRMFFLKWPFKGIPAEPDVEGALKSNSPYPLQGIASSFSWKTQEKRTVSENKNILKSKLTFFGDVTEIASQLEIKVYLLKKLLETNPKYFIFNIQ